jgi:ribosome maturation factor RimP
VTSHRADEPDRLRERVAKVVESYGLEVFDVQFRRESHGWVLRVIIDRPWNESDEVQAPELDAVSIEDCGRVSQDLSAILDVEPDLLGGLDRTYTLEVSSPGLDRPLRDARDYRRFRGRLAKVVTSAPVDGQSAFAGRLAGVEGGVVLVAQGRRTHRVPLEMIKRARLEVEF